MKLQLSKLNPTRQGNFHNSHKIQAKYSNPKYAINQIELKSNNQRLIHKHNILIGIMSFLEAHFFYMHAKRKRVTRKETC